MYLHFKFTFLLIIIANLFSFIYANCDDPQDIENGYAQTSDSKKTYEVGDEVTYICDPGYYREGGRGISKCTVNGDWTNPGVTCSPIQCERLENPQYGRIVGPGVAYLSKVTFECNNGYYRWTRFGNMEKICMEDQTWNGDEFECRPVKCPDLPDVAHGSVNPKTGVYKTKVEYKCDDQYTLKGDSSRECLINGTWSSSEPACEGLAIADSCPSPLARDFKTKFNYLKTDIKIGIEPGHKVTFICLNDEDRKVVSTCANYGQWDPQPPSKDFCIPPTSVETTTATPTTSLPTTTMFIPIDDVTVSPSQDGKQSTEVPDPVTTEATPTGQIDVNSSQTPDEESFPAWIIVLISLVSTGLIVAVIAFVLVKKVKRNRPDNDKTDAEMESFANNRAHIVTRPAVIPINNSVQRESAVNNGSSEMESLTKPKEFA